MDLSTEDSLGRSLGLLDFLVDIIEIDDIRFQRMKRGGRRSRRPRRTFISPSRWVKDRLWRWERTWDFKDHVDQTKEEEIRSLSLSRITTMCDRVENHGLFTEKVDQLDNAF